MSAVRRLLRVEAGEGPIAARMLTLMVVLWVGASIGANAIESLFFVRFGPEFLPYMYVALGAVTFAVMTGLDVLMGRLARRRILVGIPLALSVVVLVMRAAPLVGQRWVYPVLWLAMMVAWTVQLLNAWSIAGAVHDTRQAKRLFPLYGSGLIVGGVVGGLGTGPLAGALGTENLPLFWVAGLLVNAVLARDILRLGGMAPSRRPRRSAEPLLRQLGEGFRTVRGSSLLRWMALCLGLFALLYFSLTLLFAEAATARFPQADRLAGFLGLFMAVSSGSALLASLLLANRLFARFGVATMVLVLPLVYVVGFGVLAITSSFAALVAFRFVQMSWVNGVWATGWQALFNVVPGARRDRVRSFMDGIPLQAGIVVSGIVLILAQRVLRPRDVVLVGVGAAAVATLAMWRARRAYPAAVVEALRAGDPEVFVAGPFRGSLGDPAAVRVLLERTEDRDPAVRRIAMEIVAEAAPPGAERAVARGLGDADASVRAGSVRAAAAVDRAEHRERIAALLGDPDAGVRREAVRALGTAEAASRLAPLLADPDPTVRAEAAARSLAAGGEEVLRAMLSDARPDWREAAVVAAAGTPFALSASAGAVRDPDPSVRSAAVDGHVEGGGPPEALAPLLADPSPSVRERVVAALARAGPDARDLLLQALGDPLREEAALAALARTGGLDRDTIARVAGRHVDVAVRYAKHLRDLGTGDPRRALLAHGLRHAAVEHALAALEAVSAVGDREGMRLAIEGLSSRDATQRANALEAIDALGDTSVVRPLLDVWEGGPDGSGRARSSPEALLRDDDPWIRACAAFASGVAGAAPSGGFEDVPPPDGDTLVRRAEREGEEPLIPSVTLMERVMFLHGVPLFAELAPRDLKAVAEAVTEHLFPDGEAITRQGDPGDELYIVVEGELRVVADGEGGPDRELARRGPGEYVGEMAVISREPRMASLVCAGAVRVLALDRSRFERILRERPEAGLAVMRVLSRRLRESHAAAR